MSAMLTVEDQVLAALRRITRAIDLHSRGLMQQVGNPSHLDPARVAVPAGILAGALVGYVVSSLGLGLGVFVGIGVGVAVTVGLHRRLLACDEARRTEAMQADMRARAQERDKQLAQAKASGAPRS